jgi:outer membrane protein
MRSLILAVVVGAALGAAGTSGQTRATPSQSPGAAREARPFPEGFKVAFISPDRIILESAFGKASTAKMAAMRAQKVSELNAKNQELESARQKLAIGSFLSDDARAAAQKSIDRLQVEFQRAQQDAEAAVQEFQQQLNVEFDRRLTPVVEQVAIERGIYLLLRADTGTIAWADPALDLTGDVVKRLDAATTPAATRPPKDHGRQPRR